MREAGEDLAELLDERDAGAHVRVDDAAGDVDGVGHELAAEREAHRLGDRDAGLLLRLVGGRAEVRRDDDVRQAEQRRRRAGGSVTKTSRPAPAISPCDERRRSRASSSMRPPRATLTTNARRLHLRELLGADHAGGLGRLRHVDRDEVALLEQLVEASRAARRAAARGRAVT